MNPTMSHAFIHAGTGRVKRGRPRGNVLHQRESVALLRNRYCFGYSVSPPQIFPLQKVTSHGAVLLSNFPDIGFDRGGRIWIFPFLHQSLTSASGFPAASAFIYARQRSRERYTPP